MGAAVGRGGGRQAAGGVSLGGLVLALLLAGCAATHPFVLSPAPAGQLPRVALLPLEDLSGRADAGNVFARILFVELVRTRTCDVIEAGIVEAAAESLRIRNTGSLAREEVRALGARLGVAYLMLGSLLESGTVRTTAGEVPSVGVALKLLDTDSGRVVWAAMRFRTGEDRETVFGWGRQHDRQKLAAELAAEVLQGFRIPSSDSTAAGSRAAIAPSDSLRFRIPAADSAPAVPPKELR